MKEQKPVILHFEAVKTCIKEQKYPFLHFGARNTGMEERKGSFLHFDSQKVAMKERNPTILLFHRKGVINREHRRRNIRPPAATDRALRGLRERASSRPTVARAVSTFFLFPISV